MTEEKNIDSLSKLFSRRTLIGIGILTIGLFLFWVYDSTPPWDLPSLIILFGVVLIVSDAAAKRSKAVAARHPSGADAPIVEEDANS